MRTCRRGISASHPIGFSMGRSMSSRIIRALLHAPTHLYSWGLGPLFGNRFVLLTHVGRKSGVRHQTVLEVLEYRPDGPEVVVMSGFGRSEWLKNIEANGRAEIFVGWKRFTAGHRCLGEQEAVTVLAAYERRNRILGPIIRSVLSRLLGWKYRSSEDDRRRLIAQLFLIAFKPRC
jgi:deazaflavin-dependent oxidoreductase (nitroreductase family)